MRTVALSGFMGTGKSTVGARVAEELKLPFVDTDERIECETGLAVPALWQRDGEAAFRARERDVVTRILSDDVPRVLALGGGTVTTRALRHALLDRATVVTLTATPETIAARVGNATTRPNLEIAPLDAPPDVVKDPRARRLARIRELCMQRAEAYAEAHATLATDDRDATTLARSVARVARREGLLVPLGARSYVVDVVGDAEATVARVAEVLAALSPPRVVLVTDANVAQSQSTALAAIEAALSCPSTRIVIAPGEENKTLATVARIWDAALAARVDRSAVVVGVGGGVVTDLAAFAASTLLRGLRVVLVPTTLLAMVDASVGGKTGFDHEAGKNLIGTFHQASAVVLGLPFLGTLPSRELRAGLAEVVKIALATDEALLADVEANAEALGAGDPVAVLPVVRRAVLAKIRVVRDDERETGARAILNLGHTVGHALEAQGGYAKYLHGEAVALGTVLELQLGAALGLTPADVVLRAATLLQRLRLPTSVDGVELASAWRFVQADKKRVGASLRLPVVRAAGAAEVVTVRSEDARRALSIPDVVG